MAAGGLVVGYASQSTRTASSPDPRMPRQPLTLPRLLTAEEVAAMLRVHPKTVHDWAAAGEMPSMRLGTGPRARRRFDPVAVERWLDARKEGVTR